MVTFIISPLDPCMENTSAKSRGKAAIRSDHSDKDGEGIASVLFKNVQCAYIIMYPIPYMYVQVPFNLYMKIFGVQVYSLAYTKMPLGLLLN